MLSLSTCIAPQNEIDLVLYEQAAVQIFQCEPNLNDFAVITVYNDESRWIYASIIEIHLSFTSNLGTVCSLRLYNTLLIYMKK